VVAAEHGSLALLVELAALAVVAMVAKVLARLELPLQQTLVLAAAVVVKMPLAVRAVQASSSFHTHHQHNYLVVVLSRLLVATGFIHLRPLARLVQLFRLCLRLI
jgi:hypothetical protein